MCEQKGIVLRDVQRTKEHHLTDPEGDQAHEGPLEDEAGSPQVDLEVREEDFEEELPDGEAGDSEDDEERVPPDLLARVRPPHVEDEPVRRVQDEGGDPEAVEEEEVRLERAEGAECFAKHVPRERG